MNFKASFCCLIAVSGVLGKRINPEKPVTKVQGNSQENDQGNFHEKVITKEVPLRSRGSGFQKNFKQIISRLTPETQVDKIFIFLSFIFLQNRGGVGLTLP